MGGALLIFFFDFIRFNISRNCGVCLNSLPFSSLVVAHPVAEEILEVLFIQISLQPSVGCTDHLI